MNQLITLFFFLPCVVSLLWLIIYLFRVKTITQRIMMVILVLCVYYFATYAFYISPSTDYYVMALLDVCNVPVMLIILAVDLVFVCTHHNTHLYESRRHMLLYIPAMMLASVNLLIYYIIGVDNVAAFREAFDRLGSFPDAYNSHIYRLFHIINTEAVRYLKLAFIFVIFAVSYRLSSLEGYRFGDVCRFFFCGGKSTPARVVGFLNCLTLCFLLPLASIGRSYLYLHTGLGITLSLLLSVSLFLLLYVEYLVDIPVFTLRSLSHMQLGVGPAKVEEEQTFETTEASSDEEIPEGIGFILAHSKLAESVRRAFESDKVYLDANLSIQSLAAQLSTNRTTLSQVVAQIYGVPFRQLVARYRIEASKQYMIEHRDAKQEVVAADCGFATVQAFNQKFKEIEGVSPRSWLSDQTLNK